MHKNSNRRWCLCAFQVFQRQLAKEGLQQVVNNTAGSASAGSDAGDGAGIAAAAMSAEDLRDLFTLRLHTASDTFDNMCNDDGDEAADDEGGEGSGAPYSAPEVHKDQACLAQLLPYLTMLMDWAGWRFHQSKKVRVLSNGQHSHHLHFADA